MKPTMNRQGSYSVLSQSQNDWTHTLESIVLKTKNNLVNMKSGQKRRDQGLQEPFNEKGNLDTLLTGAPLQKDITAEHDYYQMQKQHYHPNRGSNRHSNQSSERSESRQVHTCEKHCQQCTEVNHQSDYESDDGFYRPIAVSQQDFYHPSNQLHSSSRGKLRKCRRKKISKSKLSHISGQQPIVYLDPRQVQQFSQSTQKIPPNSVPMRDVGMFQPFSPKINYQDQQIEEEYEESPEMPKKQVNQNTAEFGRVLSQQQIQYDLSQMSRQQQQEHMVALSHEQMVPTRQGKRSRTNSNLRNPQQMPLQMSSQAPQLERLAQEYAEHASMPEELDEDGVMQVEFKSVKSSGEVPQIQVLEAGNGMMLKPKRALRQFPRRVGTNNNTIESEEEKTESEPLTPKPDEEWVSMGQVEEMLKKQRSEIINDFPKPEIEFPETLSKAQVQAMIHEQITEFQETQFKKQIHQIRKDLNPEPMREDIKSDIEGAQSNMMKSQINKLKKLIDTRNEETEGVLNKNIEDATEGMGRKLLKQMEGRLAQISEEIREEMDPRFKQMKQAQKEMKNKFEDLDEMLQNLREQKLKMEEKLKESIRTSQEVLKEQIQIDIQDETFQQLKEFAEKRADINSKKLYKIVEEQNGRIRDVEAKVTAQADVDTDGMVEGLQKSISKFKLEVEREIQQKIEDMQADQSHKQRVDTEEELETRTQHLIQMKEETDRMIEIEEEVSKRLATFEKEKQQMIEDIDEQVANQVRNGLDEIHIDLQTLVNTQKQIEDDIDDVRREVRAPKSSEPKGVPADVNEAEDPPEAHVALEQVTALQGKVDRIALELKKDGLKFDKFVTEVENGFNETNKAHAKDLDQALTALKTEMDYKPSLDKLEMEVKTQLDEIDIKVNDCTVLGTQNEDKARHIDEEFKKHLELCQGVKSELKGVDMKVETLMEEVSQNSHADSDADDKIEIVGKQVDQQAKVMETRLLEAETRIKAIEDKPVETKLPKEGWVDHKIKDELKQLKNQFDELQEYLESSEDLTFKVQDLMSGQSQVKTQVDQMEEKVGVNASAISALRDLYMNMKEGQNTSMDQGVVDKRMDKIEAQIKKDLQKELGMINKAFAKDLQELQGEVIKVATVASEVANLEEQSVATSMRRSQRYTERERRKSSNLTGKSNRPSITGQSVERPLYELDFNSGQRVSTEDDQIPKTAERDVSFGIKGDSPAHLRDSTLPPVKSNPLIKKGKPLDYGDTSEVSSTSSKPRRNIFSKSPSKKRNKSAFEPRRTKDGKVDVLSKDENDSQFYLEEIKELPQEKVPSPSNRRGGAPSRKSTSSGELDRDPKAQI